MKADWALETVSRVVMRGEDLVCEADGSRFAGDEGSDVREVDG